jgi:hypothetical protein
MTDYLARLKARSSQKHPSDEPTKPTKPPEGGSEVGFVSFDSDIRSAFSRSERKPVIVVPPDAKITGWTDAHEPLENDTIQRRSHSLTTSPGRSMGSPWA